MAKYVQSGRARVVLLVILIGALGAVVVPRLIHEPPTRLPRSGPARVCLAVPEGAKPRGETVVHITAHRADPSGTQWWNLPIGPGSADAALLASLEPRLQGSQWMGDGAVEIVGDCLCFETAHGVGGDPGTSGLEMSFSLGSPSRESILPRIRVYALADKEPAAEVTVHIAFSAKGDIAKGSTTANVSQILLASPWRGAHDLMEKLAGHLVKQGWAAEVIEALTTDQGAEIEVRAVPGNRPLASALLTVRYDVLESIEEREPACHWVLSYDE